MKKILAIFICIFLVCTLPIVAFAEEVSDRVLFIADGNILEQNSPDEFFTHPNHPRLQEFLKKVL